MKTITHYANIFATSFYIMTTKLKVKLPLPSYFKPLLQAMELGDEIIALRELSLIYCNKYHKQEFLIKEHNLSFLKCVTKSPLQNVVLAYFVSHWMTNALDFSIFIYRILKLDSFQATRENLFNLFSNFPASLHTKKWMKQKNTHLALLKKSIAYPHTYSLLKEYHVTENLSSHECGNVLHAICTNPVSLGRLQFQEEFLQNYKMVALISSVFSFCYNNPDQEYKNIFYTQCESLTHEERDELKREAAKTLALELSDSFNHLIQRSSGEIIVKLTEISDKIQFYDNLNDSLSSHSTQNSQSKPIKI